MILLSSCNLRHGLPGLVVLLMPGNIDGRTGSLKEREKTAVRAMQVTGRQAMTRKYNNNDALHGRLFVPSIHIVELVKCSAVVCFAAFWGTFSLARP